MSDYLKGYPMQGVRTVYGNVEAERGINARLLAQAEALDNSGMDQAAALVREATNEIDRLRRKCDELVSYLNGISRQTAAMVKANSE